MGQASNNSWCDPFWSHFKGRPFDNTEGTANTTLSGAVAQDATSITVAAATGFVVGESICLGSGNNWQSFTIAVIAGSTFTIYPKVKTGGFLNGDNVVHAFGQTAHPFTTLAYTAYAQTLADMKLRRAIASTNLIGGVGDLTNTYTDARSVANVPVGWESLGTATLTATTYLSTDVLPAARFGAGTKINAAAVGDGMRTLAPIPVTVGQSLFVAAMCKHTAGTGFTIKVVDKANPTTVLGQLAAVMGDRTNFNYLSLAQVHVPFQVLAGVANIEIRIVSTGTTDECYVDDVRLLKDRQAPTEDRFLFEDPGSATIAWIGDSWGVGATAAAEQFRAALEARFGRSLAANWLNMSVSGNTLADMIARFDTDIKSAGPKILVVEYGANDVSGRSALQSVTDADQMMGKCQLSGITPVFTAFPPITGSVDIAQQRTDQIRARVTLEASVSDFRQLNIGAPIAMGTNSAQFTNYTFVNTTDQVEWIFSVPDDKGANTITITRLGYRLNGVTGVSPAMKISLQGVDTNGNPDGTIKGGASPASATFTPSGSGWQWITLANAYTANRGDLLSIVIAYSSGTLNGSNTPVITSSLWSGVSPGLPYAIHNVAGVRTRQAIVANFAFSSASRTFGMPVGTLMTTQKLNPTQTALRFLLDAAFVSTYRVAGVRMTLLPQTAGGSMKVSLYDGTTLLQQATVLYNQMRAIGAVDQTLVWFPDTTLATLVGGKEYRIALEPQDAGIYVVWYGLNVASSAEMSAFPGDGTWYASSRPTGGATAWTDDLTTRPVGELIISDWAKPSPGVIMATG